MTLVRRKRELGQLTRLLEEVRRGPRTPLGGAGIGPGSRVPLEDVIDGRAEVLAGDLFAMASTAWEGQQA